MKFALLGLLILTTPLAAQEGEYFLSERERAAIDRTLERGARWLAEQRDELGAWNPTRQAGVCPVALSAMALWASAETGAQRDDLAIDNLLGFHQPDGGLYAQERGLRVYTSGVAARALSAVNARWPDDSTRAVAHEVGLFAFRGRVPESFVDDAGEVVVRNSDHARRAAQCLADATSELPAGERAALEFLTRLRADKPQSTQPRRTRDPAWSLPEPQDMALTYEDILPLVYSELRPEQRAARRAREALRNWFALEVNPDLTRRWTSSGFYQPEQGLYYYYLTTARVLSAFRAPQLVLADGSTRYWPRELARQLQKLQNEDGAWRNTTSRWWEGEPILATSYALLALRLCRDAPPDPRRR